MIAFGHHQYICDACGEPFVGVFEVRSLRRHLRGHEPSVGCPACTHIPRRAERLARLHAAQFLALIGVAVGVFLLAVSSSLSLWFLVAMVSAGALAGWVLGRHVLRRRERSVPLELWEELMERFGHESRAAEKALRERAHRLLTGRVRRA